MANVISITGKEYIMYISKHDENSVVDCWKLLFQQLVKIWCQKSTTCKPMEKYVMYGVKTRAISLQGSVDTLVRWSGKLSCRAMWNYVTNFGVENC